MLTELIIPKQFANNIWFNMAVVQAYIGILSAILYFGRDIILSGFVKIVELLSSLIFDFWEAITILLVRTIELPMNIIEHILLQQFPIKTQRLKLISLLRNETNDIHLYNLIDNNLEKITKIKDLKVLEISIIQYCENRKYMDKNIHQTNDNEGYNISEMNILSQDNKFNIPTTHETYS